MNWSTTKTDTNGIPYVTVKEANEAIANTTALPEWAYLAVGAGVIIVLGWIVWSLIGHPIWNVWASQKEGEADLRQARNEQQIQIAQAQSRLDAAELNKKAAVVEAQAVAEQIHTIGDQLKNHDLFLRWQWIKMMEERRGETIYVPTEANLPLLEATRRTS